MKRAEIRAEIDRVMAEKGYSLGWRYWQGCTVHIMQRIGQPCPLSIRIPSGISRKRFDQMTEGISVVGPPRKPPVRDTSPQPRQIDLEELLVA